MFVSSTGHTTTETDAERGLKFAIQVVTTAVSDEQQEKTTCTLHAQREKGIEGGNASLYSSARKCSLATKFYEAFYDRRPKTTICPESR